MPNEVKLLPCPFCEGHGGIFQDDGDFYVCCTGCWSKSPLKEHKDEAIAAWNTRPTIVTDEVVERRIAEIRHWFFQTLTPEQRTGFFYAWAGVPKDTDLGLGMQYQALERIARAALAAMPAIVGGE